MLLTQLRVASVLVCVVLGGSYWAWHALAALDDENGRTHARPTVVRTSHQSPTPRTDRFGDPLPPGAAMRLGTIRFRQFPHICRVAYTPDGQLMVTDTQENTLQVWDAGDGKKLRQIDAGVEQIHDFALSPDGKLIAVVGFGLVPERNLVLPQLTFIDLATGRLARRGVWDRLSGEDELAYAPDGKTVATESDDGTLRLWDVATAKLVHQELLGGRQTHASIAFSPQAETHLLAIASNRAIHVWDTAHLRETSRITIEEEHVTTGLAFSPDGTSLAAGINTAGAEIRLWKISDGTLLERFEEPEEYFRLSGPFFARRKAPRRGRGQRSAGDLRC